MDEQASFHTHDKTTSLNALMRISNTFGSLSSSEHSSMTLRMADLSVQ